MSLTSDDIWQRLTGSGLVTAAQCQSWAAEVAQRLNQGQINPKSHVQPDSLHGLQLLQYLIDLGKLTKYQAKIVAGQSNDPLTRGVWKVLGRVKNPVFSGWFQVNAQGYDPATTGQIFWARWLNKNQLSQLRHAGPSLPRSIQLSRIQHPHFQRIEIPEMVDGELQLRVAPVAGSSLVEQFREARPSVELAQQIMQQVLGALTALHQQGLCHGRVLPDRIFWDDHHGATLTCDPICTITAKHETSSQGILAEDLRNLELHTFLAPELSEQGVLPGFSSDVYAFAVTWAWLLLGRQGDHFEATDKSLNSENSMKLQSSLIDGRLAEVLSQPMQACLRYALAPNLDARFSDAMQLQTALQAAERGLAKVPATQPTATPIVAQAVTKPNSTALPLPRRTRKKHNNNLWWIGGGLGLAALLLLTLQLSGLLSGPTSDNSKIVSELSGGNSSATQPAGTNAGSAPLTSLDPIAEHFRLVDNSELAWAPPFPPQPIELDLLSPGPQLMVYLQPSLWEQQVEVSNLLSVLTTQFKSPWWSDWLQQRTGQEVKSLKSVTLAFYNVGDSRALPTPVLRIELTQPVSVAQLTGEWTRVVDAQSDEAAIFRSATGEHYFVPQGTGSELVSKFACGPAELIREIAQANGQSISLNVQLQQLHSRCSQQHTLVMLGNPRYLFTDGKSLLETSPTKVQDAIALVLGRNSRAALVQMSIDQQWYWELQLIGGDDKETTKLISTISQFVTTAPERVERWLVEQTIHPYWRALALRYPQMLRSWREYTRFGLEEGAAIINGYLPSEAASNLLVASWLAAQPFNSLASSAGNANPMPSPASTEIDMEKMLARSIRLSFDQEPIERALALVADEANADLPTNSIVRFELDGNAFERAGITRNQQLREFRIENQPVRVALTEIAKRGNPVTTVKDTRDADQRLIWVVKQDPQQPGRKMISLTTRDAANNQQISLPAEFSAAP